MRRIPVALLVLVGSMMLLGGPLGFPSGASSKPFPFPDLPGWTLSGDVETFSPETLFDYIDGAAEAFLRYDFEELSVGQYENEKGGSLTVEIYRHRTSAHAFGIYSQERPSNPKAVQIGAQGYYGEDLLNFITGPFYVKISVFKIDSSNEAALVAAAREIERTLGEKASLPPLLTFLPVEGKKVNSEAFIARNFLGYPFLHSAYTADYEAKGKAFRLFLIQGVDEKECRLMIERYLAHLGKVGKDPTEGIYRLDDPHHGPIAVCWKGNYLWGVLGLPEDDLRMDYLERVRKRLEEK